MRNTIRNVTTVVPVLITSCQVLSKRKRGPVIPQTRMMPQASVNALVLPVQRVTAEADCSSHRPNALFFLRTTMRVLLGGSHYSAAHRRLDFRAERDLRAAAR